MRRGLRLPLWRCRARLGPTGRDARGGGGAGGGGHLGGGHICLFTAARHVVATDRACCAHPHGAHHRRDVRHRPRGRDSPCGRGAAGAPRHTHALTLRCAGPAPCNRRQRWRCDARLAPHVPRRRSRVHRRPRHPDGRRACSPRRGRPGCVPAQCDVRGEPRQCGVQRDA